MSLLNSLRAQLLLCGPKWREVSIASSYVLLQMWQHGGVYVYTAAKQFGVCIILKDETRDYCDLYKIIFRICMY